MKFHLLVAASALAVGLSMSGTAFADGYQGGQGGDPTKTTSTATAVALTDQDGAIIGAFAKGTVDGNSATGIGGTGLVNIQQNGGANSVLQDQNTLGAILNCSCSTATDATTTSLAASSQNAVVLGAVSIGAVNKTNSGATASSGAEASTGTFAASSSSGGGSSSSYGRDGYQSSKGGHNSESASGSFSQAADWSHAANWSDSETAVASANALSGFTGTGLYNISQNTGNNSMLQSANTVAVIIGK